MKTFVASLVGTLLVAAGSAGAQSAPAPLLSGGWSTGNATRLTSITGPGNLDLRVFRIDAVTLADTDVPQFTLIVDGRRLATEFSEGSSVIVEGRSIALEQTSPGTLIIGTWSVIQQPDIPAERVQWAATTRLNEDLLVASFQTEREFVLSINRTSTGCSGTAMTVTVDGVPVRDARGAVLSFPEGSSVIAKGRNVVVRASGTCSGLQSVNGDIRLARLR